MMLLRGVGAWSPVLLAMLPFLGLGCESRVSLGARCASDSECGEQELCGSSRCRRECAASMECPLGATCVVYAAGSSACQLLDDPSCPATPCSDGLVCLDGACTNGCSTDAECAAGNVCVPTELGLRACADVRTAGDAGVGVDGGAPRDPIVAIATGHYYNPGLCAIRSSGEVWCWGGATVLGRSDSMLEECPGGPCRPVPQPVLRRDRAGDPVTLTGAREVVAQDAAMCARVDSDLGTGEVLCWAGAYAELPGIDYSVSTLAEPIRPRAGGVLENARLIAMGGNHALLAVLSDPPSFFAAGNDRFNFFGEPGPRAGPLDLGLPAAEVVAIAPSWGSGCAIAYADRQVWCWGGNDVGQLGNSTIAVSDGAYSPVAVRAGSLSGAEAISGTCALVSGDVYCWGDRTALGVEGGPAPNDCASTGRTCSLTPIRTFRRASQAPFRALASRAFDANPGFFMCAIDTNDEVWCWEAGDPVLVRFPGPVSHVHLGAGNLCGIVRGELWCRGENFSGQLGLGPGSASEMPTDVFSRVIFPE